MHGTLRSNTHFCSNAKSQCLRCTKDNYIDNGIGAPSVSYTELQDFISLCRTFTLQTNSRMRSSKSPLLFWIMYIALKEGKLTTYVQYKVTDSHSYHDYRSSHDPGIKQNQYSIVQALKTSQSMFHR